MDSVTQAVFGAAVASICVPAEHRRKALLVGAALGTLPDLDVFIDYGDAVENFTYHRGFSHSLLVLAPFSVILWLALRRWWAPARDAPGPWLLAISLALLTHPLLDAHTAYGTQLLWPLTSPPVMWSTLFIIDPAFTLPILLAILMVMIWPYRQRSEYALRVGLALTTLYIGWSWIAKAIVENRADDVLIAMGLENAPVFSTPTPFNTLLWRIVVLTDEGFLEGFDSLLVDEEKMDFNSYSSDWDSLESSSGIWAVARLRWFARDFVKVTVSDERLLVSDLRMGQEPNYVFTHVVARGGNPHWHPVPTEHISITVGERAFAETWRRIWEE